MLCLGRHSELAQIGRPLVQRTHSLRSADISGIGSAEKACINDRKIQPTTQQHFVIVCM